MNYHVEVQPCEDYDSHWKHPHWYWRIDRLIAEGEREYLYDGFATYRWLACWRAFITILVNVPWGS